jgi:hypothetical protein
VSSPVVEEENPGPFSRSGDYSEFDVTGDPEVLSEPEQEKMLRDMAGTLMKDIKGQDYAFWGDLLNGFGHAIVRVNFMCNLILMNFT